MSVCQGWGEIAGCRECEGDELISILFTLQGKQGDKWINVTTAVNVSYVKAIKELKFYREIVAENPQDFLWTDFRIIRTEVIAMPGKIA